jgi:hypothetical protein
MSAVPSLTSEIARLNSNRKFQDIVRKPVVTTAKTFSSSYERGSRHKKNCHSPVEILHDCNFCRCITGLLHFFQRHCRGLAGDLIGRLAARLAAPPAADCTLSHLAPHRSDQRQPMADSRIPPSAATASRPMQMTLISSPIFGKVTTRRGMVRRRLLCGIERRRSAQVIGEWNAMTFSPILSSSCTSQTPLLKGRWFQRVSTDILRD